MAERIDPESGKVRVTMHTGAQFEEDGDGANRLMTQLKELAANPFPSSVTTTIKRPPGPSSVPGTLREKGA